MLFIIFFNTINHYISKIHKIKYISLSFQLYFDFSKIFTIITKFKIKIIENQKIVEQKIKRRIEWDHVWVSRREKVAFFEEKIVKPSEWYLARKSRVAWVEKSLVPPIVEGRDSQLQKPIQLFHECLGRATFIGAEPAPLMHRS